MKLLTTITQKLLIMATIIWMAGSAYGQSPDAFKYQAIARNNSGEPLVNQNVSFFIRILKGSESGTEVYAESHTATTNAFGLVNLELGKGSVVGSNNFPDIEWGSGSYFVEMSLDPSGGTSYQALGISPLLTVPYAMHANTADSLTNNSDFDTDPTNELQELSIKNDSLFISGGNGVLTDTDNTNELQNLSILNDSLFISGGNGVLTDTDTTNELQNLSIINDSLFLSKGNGVPIIDLLKDESVNSAKIQNGSILAEDILEGPGIAQARSGSSVTGFTNSVMLDLEVVSVTIPGPGYIFLTGRGLVRFNSSDNTESQGFIMQIDTAELGGLSSGNYSETFLTEFTSTALYIYDQTATRTYFKSTAGTYDFRLEGMLDRSNRTVTVFWPIITAIYIPTSIGTVETAGRLAGGAGQSNSNNRISVDNSTSNVPTIDLRELELKAVRARLETEKAERSLLEAQSKIEKKE